MYALHFFPRSSKQAAPGQVCVTGGSGLYGQPSGTGEEQE